MKKQFISIALILSLFVQFIPTADAADSLGSASSWAREGITSAVAEGFVPNELRDNYGDVITRQEFCRMAVNWLEYATGVPIDTTLAVRGLSRNLTAFTDTNDQDILAAYVLGITAGVGHNQFNPNGQFNREQAATMIMNTVRVLGEDVSNSPSSGFADLYTASLWAIPGIDFVRANGIMQGTGNNSFSPKAAYTREQSIITFNNIKLTNVTVSVVAYPGNSGWISGGGTFGQNTLVTIQATPYSGWRFDGWYEGNTIVSHSATWSFTTMQNRTLQARFTQETQQKIHGSSVTIKGVPYSTYVDDLMLLNINLTNADIEPVKHFTNLKKLGMGFNGCGESKTQISDISVLSGLTNLTLLHLTCNQISDISPLSNLTNLTTLYLNGNQISDINALSGLTNLTRLRLDHNQIIDISALRSLTNLTELIIDNNYEINDISALSELTNLTSLFIYSGQLRDISALSGLTNLQNLSLGYSPVSDIKPLFGLTNLKELTLYGEILSQAQKAELRSALPNCVITYI